MPILFLLQQLLTTTTITAEISASLCILDTHNRGPNLYDAIFYSSTKFCYVAGYYPHPTFSDHKAAQMLMIENSLRWAFNSTEESLLVRTPNAASSNNSFRFVDVGCGVGGSSRYIARKLQKELGVDATVSGQGISLSPVQVQRATEVSLNYYQYFADYIHVAVVECTLS